MDICPSMKYIYTMHMHIQDGYFPLYVASDEGDDEIVEMLLQARAKVDLQTKVENCVHPKLVASVSHLC